MPHFDATTELALERTRLAADRTLMAWIRTAFSMITFGFTVAKVFQLLGPPSSAGAATSLVTSRVLGLTLIGVGTLALGAGAWDYHRALGRLRALGPEQRASGALLTILLLVAIFGAVAFVGAVLP